MKSRLYEGLLRHRRLTPRPHEFEYRVFMPYLCLDELPALFADKPLWSANGRALGEFRRSDFLGDPDLPLADEVRRRIREETGNAHSHPWRSVRDGPACARGPQSAIASRFRDIHANKHLRGSHHHS